MVTFWRTPSSSIFTLRTTGFLFVADASTTRVPGSTGTPAQSGSPFGSPSTLITRPATRASAGTVIFTRERRFSSLSACSRANRARLSLGGVAGVRLLLDGAELAPRGRGFSDVLVTQREVQQRAQPRVEAVALAEQRTRLLVLVLRHQRLGATEEVLGVGDLVASRAGRDEDHRDEQRDRPRDDTSRHRQRT